jgi:hypothetical protein
MFESDNDVLTILSWQLAQDLGKIARREFCHSTGAVDHLRQTHCHSHNSFICLI